MKKLIIPIFLITAIAVLSSCNGNSSPDAQKYCDGEHDIYICGTNIKAVSILPGAGSTYYKSDGTDFNCPVIAPDSMSAECKELLFDDNCIEVCKANLSVNEDAEVIEVEDPKTEEAEENLSTLEKLQKETDIDFSNITDASIVWHTSAEDLTVNGQEFEAVRISDQQYRSVEKFLTEQRFDIDVHNVAAGTIGWSTGYIKGKEICKTLVGVTGYKKAEGQWIPPEPDKKDLEVQCGFLEKEIDETDGWQTYKNDKYGYSFKYPTDCSYGPLPGHCKQSPPEERPKECRCYLNGEDQNEVSLGTFTGTKSALTGATFNVLSPETDAYTPKETDLVVWLKEKFQYQEMPDESNMELGGIPAVKVYTPQSPGAYSQENIYFIKNDKLFNIYVIDVDNEGNKKLYNQIINTFKFSG